MSLMKPNMPLSRSRLNLADANAKADRLGSLVDMFHRIAKEKPEAEVVFTEEYASWSLRQLDETTDKLAAHFTDKFGAHKGCIVGIYMDKCTEYVLSYIAALKCGGGYLPLDISYPRPLLECVLNEAKPVVVCTKPEFSMHLLGVQKNVFNFDHQWKHELPEGNSAKGKLPDVGPDDLAYVVYSSGTTGQPKGIQCPHKGAVLSYTWRMEHYPYKPDDRVACNVFFVWEMFRPILQGIPMYIIPDNVIYDPTALCQFIERYKITRVLFTPSLLQTIIDTQQKAFIKQTFQSLRVIWLCGEVVTVQLLSTADPIMPWVSILNLYSVSECHDVAVCDLTAWIRTLDSREKTHRQFAPVGQVFKEVKVAILDNKLKKQPVGMSGEIFVAGPTLAIGYLHRPEINAKRFLDAPEELSDEFGDRLYRTGDWGYLLSDGSLEICGRCDSMVKVRGYSVELQAIESTLLQLPYVLGACVMTHGAEGEDKQLVAYLVLKENKTKKELRAALKLRLPFYMIPMYLIIMESLPIVAATGKVDKKALPSVNPERDIVEPESLPQTETERRLAKVWMEILGLKSIDIQESFFDLGGHSLLAARLLGKVQEEFGVRLAVRDLFSHSSVSSFSRLLETDNTRCSTPQPQLNLEDEVEKHDLKDAVMDLHLRAFWRSVKMLDDRFKRGCVLLTGASGFLGSSILRELMMHSRVQCICLIRESPSESAEQRLLNAMSRFGLLDEQMKEWINNRITVMKGDVTLMQFGLSDDDYHFVSYEVDFVVHAAAYVNLIYPYQALHGGNVLGTQNVIVFCYSNKVKPLHYVSTDAVVPPYVEDFPETGEFDDLWQRLEDGYGQSKWVAEQLVLRSQKRGLPVFIYRLGNQAPDHELGTWNPADFTYLMLYGCASIGLCPNVDWKCEMTPVDFTARFICKVRRFEEADVQVATERFQTDVGKIFHLTQRDAPMWRDVVKYLKRFGYEMSMQPYNDWKASIGKALSVSDSNPNLRMLDRLLELYLRDEEAFTADLQPTLSRENTDAVLAELGWTYPDLNEAQVHRWLKRMTTHGQMPRPLTQTAQPLEGRVAIVTGASGGIGEAIAYKLAVEGGAKVVVAARREEKLQDLCKRIKDNHGEAKPIKCDVTDREQVRELVERTSASYGPINILVNNAGIMYYTKMETCAEQQWHAQIDLNCKGTMNCIGAVLPSMVERKSGHIVNISSDAGLKAFPGLAVYSGTKFFIEGMSTALRQEMAPHNVKVTCVEPGDVATELAGRSTDMAARQEYDGTLGEHKVLEPDDIASAVLYACKAPEHVAVNQILVEPTAAPL